MSRRIQETPFAALLPESIKHDAGVAAAASALDPALRDLVRAVPNLLLFSRLGSVNSLGAAGAGKVPTPGRLSPVMQRLADAAGGLKPLSEAELELLAWQFHVDFREVAKTPAELAVMVRESIPWHRIKGTPASIKAALALYGITATIEEDGEGNNWATYQLNLHNVETLDGVRLAQRVATEMAPVRCRLRRVYNDLYDDRYIIWTRQSAWSRFYWSFCSGVRDPETGLIISLGGRHAAQGELGEPQAFAVLESCGGLLVRYVRSWIWGYSRWSEKYPPACGFVHGQLGTHLLERADRPWSFRRRRVAREQLVWSGADRPVPVGQWGDSNCRWSKGVFLLFRSPRWGASRWSESNGRELVVTLERRRDTRTGFALLSDDGLALPFSEQTAALRLDLHPENVWKGNWNLRKWSPAPPVPHRSSVTRLPRLRWSSRASVWGKAVW